MNCDSHLRCGPCPICASMQTVHAWNAVDLNWKSAGSFPYLRCKGCGSLFRPVDSKIPAGAYPMGYGTYLDPTSALIGARVNSSANRRRAALLESLQQPGSILDVGCGSGFFLAYLRSRGWQTQGLESAEEHVTFARDILGLPNIVQDAWPPENHPSLQYDAVTMVHLIEHLRDPLKALKAARHSLCKGGVLLLETPNIDSWPARLFGSRWVTLDAPRHRVLFSRKSLEHCLVKADFEQIRMTTYSPSTMEWGESLRYWLPRALSAGNDTGSVSLPPPSIRGGHANSTLHSFIQTFHKGERVLYRFINVFANVMGSGNNLLAIAIKAN